MRLLISPLQYDNLSRISIRQQAFDGSLPNRMKQIKGSRWAPELGCWHIPYTAEAWSNLKMLFSDYEIVKMEDESARQKPSQISTSGVSDHNRPEYPILVSKPPFPVIVADNERQAASNRAPVTTDLVSKGRPPGHLNPGIASPRASNRCQSKS